MTGEGPPPHLILVAGPSGSGKSELMETLRSNLEEPYTYINADDVAMGLMVPHSFGVVLAVPIVSRMVKKAVARGDNVILETTFNNRFRIRNFLTIARAGYEVEIVALAAERPEIGYANIGRRVEAGGHGKWMLKNPEYLEKAYVRFEKRLHRHLHRAFHASFWIFNDEAKTETDEWHLLAGSCDKKTFRWKNREQTRRAEWFMRTKDFARDTLGMTIIEQAESGTHEKREGGSDDPSTGRGAAAIPQGA